MLGWINVSIASFICDTFGVDKWEEVVKAAGVNPNWVATCPYSDKVTYDVVVTAAAILGVSVNDALEAYGLYFVQHVEDQGYTRLLKVLGSNLAEFLQNLNDLHLHLQYCWPDMLAPAFRCEQVTAESLDLHYFSNRPGLWPIVVGVLKGLSNDYFKLDLQVELVHSREKGDCDHEVLKLTYPFQPVLRDWGKESAAAQRSIISMPAPMFYELHPFHLLMDRQLQLLQWGAAIGRVVPDLRVGQHVRDLFKCKVPSYIQMDYDQILVNTNSSFVLQSRKTGVTLKGEMLPTTAQLPGAPAGSPPSPVLLFLASPWMRSLTDMQASGVYLSDIPRYDLSSDYILLAEQRQAEADLKEKYERLTLELQAANEKLARTTNFLEEEKARAEALLYRMSALIACFPAGPNAAAGAGAAAAAAADGKQPTPPSSQSVLSLLETTIVQSQSQQLAPLQQPLSTLSTSLPDKQSSALDRIEAVRRELARFNINSSEAGTIQCLELLGEGTYGKVYKGLWKGTVVAVKTIVLPAVMSGQEKREKMAIMEAAISSALSHPNIMQTYTYDIKPIKDSSRPEQKLVMMGSTASSEGGPMGGTHSAGTADNSDNIHSYEVRLVCEYCDKGSLREALDLGAFKRQDGSTNYPAVLDTAIEIATAVAHLHQRHVLHSDLKARNIMLKSTGGSGRGVTAKVADFGLAVKMDHLETHLSNAFQGTLTHMAPEILIKGHISKAADVYAFGMVLWELYTAQKVFKGIPRALLGHQITQLHRRPEFPADAPSDYVKVTQACWEPTPAKRPTLEMVLEQLQALRASLRRTTDPLSPYDIESMIVRKASMGTANKAHMRSPMGQHPWVARSPNMQQQHQQGGTPSTSRSAHAGRMQLQHQQTQRQHRAARRAVSTPQLQAGHTGSPPQQQQQQQRRQQQQQEQLRSAFPSSPQPLQCGVSGASSPATAAVAGSSSITQTSGQQQQQQQLSSSPLASSHPGPGVLTNSLQQIWDDGEYIETHSDRSVYLEHSASTGDEDPFCSWNGAEGVDSQDMQMHLPGVQLSLGTLAHPSIQHGQQGQHQSEHPTCGFGSFTSQPSTSTSLIGSRALGGCPYVATAAAAAAARGAAAAAASPAGSSAAAGDAGHNAGPES